MGPPTSSPGLTADHVYTWYVGVQGAGGAVVSWLGPYTFTLASPQISPSNGETIAASAGYDKPTFTWAALAGSPSYSLDLVDDNTGASTIVPAGTGTSYQFSKALTPGHYYTWYVGIQGAGSSVSWFGPATFLLATPQISPGGGQTITPTAGYDTPTFTWAGLAGLPNYSLDLVDDSTGASKLVPVGAGTTYQFSTPLTAGHNYSWYLGIQGAGGVVVSWYGPENFTLASPQISPYNGETLVAVTGYDMPTFTWVPLSGATGYNIALVDASNPSAAVQNFAVGSATTTYQFATPLTPGQTYVWYIGKDGAGGAVTWSGPSTFTVSALARRRRSDRPGPSPRAPASTRRRLAGPASPGPRLTTCIWRMRPPARWSSTTPASPGPRSRRPRPFCRGTATSGTSARRPTPARG